MHRRIGQRRVTAGSQISGTTRAYPHLPAARADLLARLGRRPETVAELERAAGLSQNGRERALLQKRAAALQEDRVAVARPAAGDGAVLDVLSSGVTVARGWKPGELHRTR